MSVTLGGTFSGLNVSSIIQSIIAADSIPITNLQTTNTTLSTNSTDLGALSSSLGQLSTQLQALNSSLFSSQVASVTPSSVGSASVSGAATNGITNLNVTQLATPTVLLGGSSGGAFATAKLTAPPAGDTPIGTVLNESSVDGQTFTINGKQIALSRSDVLDDGNPSSTSSVIGKINNSGAGVTASYDSTTGAITLQSQSSSAIVLGSATDTSDFLQQAQLFNNGSGSVTSSIGIGRIDPTADLSTAGLETAPTTGTFTVNGVSLTYGAGETLQSLIGQINSSSAGVTAIYDTYQDQLVLTSNQPGPQNITVADGTSNIATALRLASSDSQLQVGKATLFTVGNSTTVRQSTSNVLSSTELGVAGVTFTATGTGTAQINVTPDTTTIANAINAFVTQYNSTQTLVASDTQVDPTDATQNGPLATDNNLAFLASELRQTASNATNFTAAIRMLGDLGVGTNANDNTLTQVDSTKLQDALTNHLSDVQALFDDPTSGLTATVQGVIDSYSNPLNGVIVNEQNDIKSQIAYNTAQITRMQEQISVQQTQLENEFAALDSIQGTSQGLSNVLNGTTSSSSSGSSSSGSSSSSFGSVGSGGS